MQCSRRYSKIQMTLKMYSLERDAPLSQNIKYMCFFANATLTQLHLSI